MNDSNQAKTVNSFVGTKDKNNLSVGQKVKQTLFEVLIILLDEQDISILVDALLIYSELIQWWGFSMHIEFGYIWKKYNVVLTLNNFINYFQISVYFVSGTVFIIVFYVCISIVVLMIANLIYVIISVLRKKFAFVWPLRTLRSVASVIVTILFMPMFEVFLSMLQCSTNSDAIQISSYDSSLVCWQGAHIVHVIFAIVFSVIFVIICTAIQLCNFDSRFSIHDHNSRSNSRADAFLILSKIVNTLLMFYMYTYHDQHWIILIIQWIFSFLMFFNYYYYHPYYNETSHKIRVIYTGIYLWTNSVMIIGKILEKTEFNSCFELLFLGIIFIVMYFCFHQTNRLKYLLQDNKLYSTKHSIINQINHLLALIELKDKDRKARQQLNGYVYTLVALSENDVYSYLKSYVEAKETRNIESVSYLYQHVKNLYQDGLKMFPYSTELRISYAYFLLDTVKNKKLAMEQLELAMLYNPPLDEQFTIYRCKKLIEESTVEESENLDIISNIAYINYFNQFKLGIYKTAELYLEFWTLLLNPNHQDNYENLAKLNELGTKINQVLEEISAAYAKMKEIKQIDMHAIRLYSEFLFQILNEKEKSSEMKKTLEEMEFSNVQQIENLDSNELNINPSIENENILMVSADHDNIGTIINASTGISSLLGFTKKELIGSSLDLIIQGKLIEEHKRAVVQKSFDYKNEVNDNIGSSTLKIKFDIRHNKAFALSKARFIVPLDLKVVISYSTLQSGFAYFCKLDLPKNHDNPNICKFFVNVDLILMSCTTNSYILTGIDYSDINSRNISVVDYILDFQHEGLGNSEKSVLDDSYYNEIERYLEDNFTTPNRIKFLKPTYASTNSDMGKYQYDGYRTRDFSKFTGSDRMNAGATLNKGKGKNLTNQIFSMLLQIDNVKLNGVTHGYIFTLENANAESKTEYNLIQHNKADMHLTVEENFIPKIACPFQLNLKGNTFMKCSLGENDKEEVRRMAIEKMKQFKEETEKKKKLDNLENYSNEELEEEEEEEEVEEDEENEDLHTDKVIDLIRVEETLKAPTRKHSGGEITPQSNQELKLHANKGKAVIEVNKDKVIADFLNKQSYVRLNISEVKLYKFSYTNNKIMKVNSMKAPKLKIEQSIENAFLTHHEKQRTITKKDEKMNHRKEPSGQEQSTTSVTQNESKAAGTANINQAISKSQYSLIKQIEFSLSKQEDQTSITYIKTFSFFFFLMLIGFVIGFFVILMVVCYTPYKKAVLLNYQIQNYSTNLKKVALITRNLIIFNKYYQYSSPNPFNQMPLSTESVLRPKLDGNSSYILKDGFIDTAYISNSESDLKDIYQFNNNVLENYIVDYIHIFDDASYNSTQQIQDTNIYEINVNKSVQIAHTDSLYTVMSDINYNIYSIVKKNMYEVNSNDKLSINLIHYILNEVDFHLKIIKSVILTNLDSLNTNFTIIMVSVSAGFLIFLVVTIILINYFYVKVERRKESYLEVFLEIPESIIQNSIDKCEEFNKKFSTEEVSENQSVDFNNKTTNNETQNFARNSNKAVQRDRKSSSKRHYGIRLLLSIPFALFYIVIGFSILYTNYNLSLQFSNTYVINALRKQENYIINIFNGIREIYSQNILYINREDLKASLQISIDQYFDLKKEIDSTINQYSANLANFTVYYKDTYYINSCDIDSVNLNLMLNVTSAFRYYENPNCLFLQIQNQSTGLNIFITKLKESFSQLFNKYLNSKPEDYASILVSDEMKELTMIVRFVVNPSIDFLCGKLNDSIASINDSLELFVIIYYIILICVVMFCYFGYWVRFLNKLNQTIYKTKNMLYIIPKEVLASLTTIPKLLEIKDNRRGAQRQQS